MNLTKRTIASGSELLAQASDLRSLFADQAGPSDELGQLTDPVIDALHESGLAGMWIPQAVGGSEVTPLEGARIIEEVAQGDGSTAWVLFAGQVIAGTAGAYFANEAVEEMFGDERLPMVAGHGTRPGTAVPQSGGGFEVSGTWSFGSGIKHAQWTHNLAIVEGSGEPIITTTPIGEADLDWDSWRPIGLRATGSIDYRIDKAQVPASFTHSAGAHTSDRGGPLYNLGIIGMICCGHGAWALGISRSMLDGLRNIVAAKAGRAGSQAESTAFLEKYEIAEARQRAARAFFYETWGSVGETLYDGEPLSMEQQTLLRLALSNATWSSHEVALCVYELGGTASIHPGPIQRAFRDMETGIQHITSGPNVRYNIARSLLGVADEKHWEFLELAD
jgi:indole-3-acetate monooxygenase